MDSCYHVWSAVASGMGGLKMKADGPLIARPPPVFLISGCNC